MAAPDGTLSNADVLDLHRRVERAKKARRTWLALADDDPKKAEAHRAYCDLRMEALGACALEIDR